ncbi:DNA-binding LacI/PurR family transcriptional regulator [Spinactinospora alkalitolerans]|uniref:DNA-binding LacI/PurR family transcriptional regulator n=1 Tax=Spinactinospora alkalitolerans TaxID=687207 RepID=A0A852U001_9ACTN|nr:LacI family DNA-binding transcriptional regulator [Spinactinospora alkalitolerans]NYE48885.1 DNA-binding LacI/PurR family transcriptional regulator [Spinactinospora alkalitolerans]
MGVRRQRPTLEMVAELAGVGRGTVSRVINGSQQVSPATRDAVLRAVKDLGYVPNHAARTLVTQRTDMIALVVSEHEDRLFAQPFFADIVRGVSSVLNDRGLQLLLATARSSAEHERLGEYLTGRHVDGVLAVSLHRDDPLPARLARADVPCVHGGRPLGPVGEPLCSVDIDNVGGARSATRHLLDSGRSRIGTVAGPQDMVAGVDRLRGYQDALLESGQPASPDLIAYGDFSYEGGERAVRSLLAASPRLDAVFVASDLMALAALRVLREAGRRVPDDVAVVGFDDSALALHSDPPLTTVHQPTEKMGREMARILADWLAYSDRAPANLILDTYLVVRESA